MMLDYKSLLMALAVSTTCLALISLGSWCVRRSETFLLTCTLGLVLIVIGIVAYGMYVDNPMVVFAGVAFVLFHAGFATIWGAGYQFRTDRLPLRATIACALVAMLASIPPLLVGYDGLAFIAENTAIAAMLFATGYQYWRAREEALAPLTGITALYCMTAISFVLCAAVLIFDGRIVLGAAPSNWAEDLSIAICIASMTGIGALSLALHQWRLAARHRLDAMTDPLTGLVNRRALFDRYGQGPIGPATAVLIFDLDHFKSINDSFGHAGGDRVLKVFAADLAAHCGTGDIAARLGGEEFALVLKEVMPGRAEMVAECIRKVFASREIYLDEDTLRCTVSVGVAPGRSTPIDFDAMLSAADKALYVAKRAGRNRIELAGHLHSIPAGAARAGS
ncbi:GGDEF domain-containing protein [Rhizobium mesoamericanum]|uniref:diguanylate cyclase n=1 Tax=Rhizobium mesoamericanum STM3625 TaxID=1211777 RepID=K0PWP7_9HYPH|nr:GGDEF domain-containing protein [Rhizobium mesoamericanum]CCM74224.1 Diguanylate cyclase [Rhizobium mesoamericanum STM3625]